MNENGYEKTEANGECFNVLAFERKLAELVEELHMKRNIEKENEKNLESLLDEKYRAELSFDEQKRNFTREKEFLEQQIDILKRKLEDKICVSNDKEKLQIMNKTYSHEIRVLKEELRTAKSEVLTLQKSLQEADGKLNLHKTFQASIMSQVSKVQASTKSTAQEFKQLKEFQNDVMENVSRTKELLEKQNIANQNLQQVVAMAKQKIETLKKELVSQKSELIVKRCSVMERCDGNAQSRETEKLQEKILEMDQLLLLSRRENEITLNNFLESNKLLSQFMERYAELQLKEKSSRTELDLLRNRIEAAEASSKISQDELRKLREKIEERSTFSMFTQTDETTSAKRENHHSDGPPVAEDFVEATRNDLAELQKNAVILQSEKLTESEA